MKAVSCILLGAPGSGKGTQAKRLEVHFGIPHISTGDIFRSEINSGSALGLKVKEIISSGALVNDELTTEIVAQRFSKPDVKKGFLLDGFPRTIPQAESLNKILQSNGLPSPIAVYLNLSKDVLMKRLLGRLSCTKCGSVFHREFNPPKKDMVCDACGSPLQQRKDDTEEAVKKRLKVFDDETAVLLNYYSERQQLQTVDALLAVDDITKVIIEKLQAAS